MMGCMSHSDLVRLVCVCLCVCVCVCVCIQNAPAITSVCVAVSCVPLWCCGCLCVRMCVCVCVYSERPGNHICMCGCSDGQLKRVGVGAVCVCVGGVSAFTLNLLFPPVVKETLVSHTH